MGRPAGRKNVAGKVRATFMRLTESQDGKDPRFNFDEALLSSLQSDFVGTMRMLKNYIPTEMLLMPDEGDGEQGELSQIFRLQVVAADGSIIHESEPAEPMEPEPIEGDFEQVPQGQGIQVRAIKPGEAV